MIGTLVGGKYLVVRRIGAGGMGAVFEAEHQGTGRRVAVKVLSKNLLTEDESLSEVSETVRSNVEEVVARFEREARTAARIESQHVVQILDAGRDSGTGRPYMVMELLRGETLRQALKSVKILRPDTALRVVAQACRGLMAAHEAGVIHRDIKLGNLLLAEQGEGRLIVKILDFGIARVRMDEFHKSHQGPLTRTGSLLGSPQYMSPEQSRGLKTIDHRADLWSLGVVLYRCLCGQTPFDAPTLGELILSLFTKAPPPIQELAPWVSAEAATIVHRALKRDLDQRFVSAREMLEAVLAALPHGAELHKSMIAAPSEAERAVVALRMEPELGEAAEAIRGDDVAHAGEDAAHSLADASDTRLEFRTEGEPAKRSASWPWISAAVAVVLALGGLTAGRLMRDSTPEQASAESSAPAQPTEQPSAAAAPVITTSSVADQRTVSLTVEPADAAVTVDGSEARVADGQVRISGSLGSVHRVSLTHGTRERTIEVVITEQGARPSEVTLEAAKAARPTARGRHPATSPAAPKSTGRAPTPTPAPTRTGRVGAVESFE